MKILLVANGYPPLGLGGVEIYTQDLAQGLARRGHHATVLCRQSDLARPDYTRTAEVVDGVEVVRVVNDHKRSVSIRDTFIDPQIEAIFRDFVQENRPEVIHFNHLIGLSARLPLIAADLGIPSIITLHDYWPICHQIRLVDWRGRACPGPESGGDCMVCIRGGTARAPRSAAWARWAKTLFSAQARRRIRRALFPRQSLEAQPSALALADGDLEIRSLLFRRAILRAAGILVPSAYVRRQYAANGYPAERIEVLPLGVNMDPCPASPRQHGAPLTVAAIGPFIPAKGLHTLIQALRAAPAGNLRLRLVGRDDVDPAYTQELKRLAADDERIRFSPAFPPEQRSQVYAAIDVLALPSLAAETFSLAAREALVCGKPVVAARVGALPEIVEDGVNGFVFEPGNVAELAGILARLAADPGSLSGLSLPGPTPIFSVAEHVRSIEARYRAALDQAQVSSSAAGSGR